MTVFHDRLNPVMRLGEQRPLRQRITGPAGRGGRVARNFQFSDCGCVGVAGQPRIHGSAPDPRTEPRVDARLPF
jgi:hypothetical protein